MQGTINTDVILSSFLIHLPQTSTLCVFRFLALYLSITPITLSATTTLLAMSDSTSQVSSDASGSPASTPPTTVPPSPTIASINPDDISDEDRAKAARIKTEAGAAFKSAYRFVACFCPLGFSSGGREADRLFLRRIDQEFNKAADLYTQAIELNPLDATIWCNRAFVRTKLEEHGYALADAGASLLPLFLFVV